MTRRRSERVVRKLPPARRAKHTFAGANRLDEGTVADPAIAG